MLRDVLPDVPRPILSRDEAPPVPVEERPVPRNMKNFARHSQEVRLHARLCKIKENCRTTNIHIQAWLTRRSVVPGSRQQAGQTLCIVIELNEESSERWISTQRKLKQIDHPRRASLEPNIVPEPSTEENEGEGARDAKRARG